MAIRDIAEIGDNTGGNEGDDRSIPSVDPVEITIAARDDSGDGNAPLGYLPNGQPRRRRFGTRRTREQIEADRASGIDKPRASPSPQKGSPLSVNSIQFGITGIHALLAAGMAMPELELTETEAKTISENIVAVARHYDLQQTQKATDIGNLVISLGIVYGGRIVRISARKNAERAAKRSAASHSPVGAPIPQPPAAASGPLPRPNGSRPKTDADLVLLNEHEPYVA